VLFSVIPTTYPPKAGFFCDGSPKAHAGLVVIYVEDERFTANYDQDIKGCAAFLKAGVLTWLKG
jgi:hypothetical protein